MLSREPKPHTHRVQPKRLDGRLDDAASLSGGDRCVNIFPSDNRLASYSNIPTLFSSARETDRRPSSLRESHRSSSSSSSSCRRGALAPGVSLARNRAFLSPSLFHFRRLSVYPLVFNLPEEYREPPTWFELCRKDGEAGGRGSVIAWKGEARPLRPLEAPFDKYFSDYTRNIDAAVDARNFTGDTR